MFLRLLLIKSVLRNLVFVCTDNEEREKYDIDPAFVIAADVVTIINDGSFWSKLKIISNVFDPICKCIGVLESDTVPMSTAYACVVYVLIQIDDLGKNETLSAVDCTMMKKCLLRRWNRIKSPAHTLAFLLDPLFKDFIAGVKRRTGGLEMLELGNGDMTSMAVQAIGDLSTIEEDPDSKAMNELVLYLHDHLREQSSQCRSFLI